MHQNSNLDTAAINVNVRMGFNEGKLPCTKLPPRTSIMHGTVAPLKKNDIIETSVLLEESLIKCFINLLKQV